MYNQKTNGNHCCADGVYYPRFGGDLGLERHWEVEDVKKMLFGSLDIEQPQGYIAAAFTVVDFKQARQDSFGVSC
jgi:hypothetical protein